MAYEFILYEKSGAVVTITLNRPEAMNAITPALEAELHAALDEADADNDVRAIILTGSGRAFSAGYDMARPMPDGRRGPLDPAGLSHNDYLKHWWANDTVSTHKLLHLWNVSKPIIGAINGYAMGGGFWYATATDITLASDQAVFGQPEVRHISNTTFLFVQLCGWKVANRYALTGDHFDAPEALRVGLINEIVPHDQLMDKARELAERLAKVPEASVRYNKMVAMQGLIAAGVGAGMALNGPLSALAHTSHSPEREVLFDAQRNGGMKAFLQERDGKFQPEPFGPRSKKS